MHTEPIKIDVIPSPFRAARVECESPAGLTVRQIIGEGLNLDRRQIDIAVIHNGMLVPETCWGTVVPELGDRVTVSVVPAGGGGGKNIVALIAIIAVSVVAPFAGTAIAGALGLSGTVATLVGSGIAAGVVVGGATLVNRFVRAPEQQLSAVEQDPVWSISGIRNTFPTRQTPIPSLFGTDRLFPHYAARPFTSIETVCADFVKRFMVHVCGAQLCRGVRQ